ncbi:MAG TPA: hypothetical protein VNA25_22430, partial [Phycisphaerae bacterium]|nr:hypothetical protein [Phycisphaerae bacterium]
MNNAIQTKRVFVVFRYKEKLQDTVEHLKEHLEQGAFSSDLGWQIDVLDDMLPPSTILFHGVIEAIRRTDFVVVLAESISLNVAFEAGVAYALGKPTVFCVPQDEMRQLFQRFSDLAGMKVVPYNPDRATKVPAIISKQLMILHAEASAKAQQPPS